MKRKSGVLMHISSLPGDFSCGSFGEKAKQFVDFLRECGFSYWQVLPFCPVDEYNSPYKSCSAFGGNPYFIDPELLYKKDLVTFQELKDSKQNSPFLCEFRRLSTERMDLLMKASKRVDDRDEIEDFIRENPYLESFCRFMALKYANNGKEWQRWNETQYNPDVLFMWKFIQFEFFRQWSAVKEYANRKGVKIIGDLPFYVSLDSVDVWEYRDGFSLDEKGYPTLVAGVPPDYFSENGQLWGNPVYNWNKMKEDGYKWWTDRIEWMLKSFDGLRIDHFRAFESYWTVKASETTAKNGRWIQGPGMDIVSKFRVIAGDRLIIAEDLGHITKEVEKLVRESGFSGMRVFQFGFFGDESIHQPHNYDKNCVAYSGTHDNNTLLGYLWELDGKKRQDMLEYCGYTDSDWTLGMPAVLRTIWGSCADVVMVTIQDVLGYGEDTRLNYPGRAENNWGYRVTTEQLESINKKYFKRLNELYYR